MPYRSISTWKYVLFGMLSMSGVRTMMGSCVVVLIRIQVLQYSRIKNRKALTMNILPKVDTGKITRHYTVGQQTVVFVSKRTYEELQFFRLRLLVYMFCMVEIREVYM